MFFLNPKSLEKMEYTPTTKWYHTFLVYSVISLVSLTLLISETKPIKVCPKDAFQPKFLSYNETHCVRSDHTDLLKVLNELGFVGKIGSSLVREKIFETTMVINENSIWFPFWCSWLVFNISLFFVVVLIDESPFSPN